MREALSQVGARYGSALSPTPRRQRPVGGLLFVFADRIRWEPTIWLGRGKARPWDVLLPPPPGPASSTRRRERVGEGRLGTRVAMRYAFRMAQLVTRVDDELAAAVDELVAAGVVASRSEAVRLGLERLVDRHRRDQIGARIAEGYRRLPQTNGEVGWADESSVRMIAEEPW